uniref:Tyrosine-protein phosphatase non-receptor type 23 n=1 Tax=Lutzomyia longipalpis TaxID=7200 RepID=A0A1B0CJL9_LUTLO
MEAVPRLPMLSFDVKQSHEPTSFTSLKRYIAELYHEDPESYAKEFHALESLRNSAVRATRDTEGCSTIKRYYCQLHSLVHRFMSHTTEHVPLSFAWKELYSGTAATYTDINQEMAAVLYNAGALHTQLGAAETRTSEEGMKLVCTHFQCAAWIFGHLRDNFKNTEMSDLSGDLLLFMQQLSFAQAHECILEKSLTDNRKAATVATVACLIVNFYNVALAALTTGGDDGIVCETVGSRTYKEWKRYVKFKIAYLTAILYPVSGGNNAEDGVKRVTLFQAAFDRLDEARKESKGMPNQEQIAEALTFTMDVIEAKRNAAKKENEYIYHEQVPDLATIPAVKAKRNAAKKENEYIYHEQVPDLATIPAVEKKLMMNGIGFNPSDPEYVNNDIFHRLVPMEAHEGSSLYSEEKAALLRHIGAKVEEKDDKLNAFSCSDVESMLQEIRDMLDEEDAREKSYQKTMGARPSGHFSELIREYQKYHEAHNKAGESNETLRKAMGLHVSNLKTLAQPLNDITALVPTNKDAADESHFAELKHLLGKVNTMKAQRATLVQKFRDAVTADDITGKIVTWEKKLEKLFKKELAKHDKCVALIEQNLAAQDNILKALTDAYAKCAPQMKAVVETKHKREHFFSSLAASYDIYEDLLGKSVKGLEFYRKLQGNIQKLLARIKAARDVQEEERQQRLKSTNIAPSPSHSIPESIPTAATLSTNKSGPKLKDYLKSGTLQLPSGTPGVVTTETAYIPPAIRPNPLGSENTSTSTCVTTTTSDKFMSQTVLGGYQNTYYQAADPGLQQGYGSAGNLYQTDSGQQQQQQQQQQQYYMQQPQQSLGQSTQNQTGFTNPIYQSQFYYTTAQGATSQSGGGSIHDTFTNPVTQTSASNYQPPLQSSADNTLQHPMYGYYGDQALGYSDASSVNSYSAGVQQAPPITTHSSGNNADGGHLSTYIDPQQAYYNQNPYNSYQTTYSTTTDQQNQTYYQQQQQQQPIASPGLPASSGEGVPNSQAAAAIGNLTQQVAGWSLNQTANQTYSTSQAWDASGNYGQGQKTSDTPAHADASKNQYGYSTTNQYEGGGNVGQMYGQMYGGSAANDPYSAYNQQQIATAQYGATSQPYSQLDTSQMGVSNYPQNQYSGQTQSYASHPGYMYNQLTGEYQYASGYQVDAAAMTQYAHNHYSSAGQSAYGQTIASPSYNSAVSPHDASQMASMVQHVSSTTGQVALQPAPAATNIESSSSVAPPTVSAPAAAPISIAPTPSPATAVGVPASPAKSSNFDLLSGIDFSTPEIPTTPLLQPKVVSADVPSSKVETNNEEVLGKKIPAKEASVQEVKMEKNPLEVLDALEAAAPADVVAKPIQPHFERKQSADSASILSQLESLDQSFSETSSVKNDDFAINEGILGKYRDALDDPTVRKWFHKEVERMEKFIEGINIKTLNGSTPLDTKWKELQDLLVKDESKRTITVAKWFYEKNWKNLKEDYVPYDHARVVLPTETEDYINAAYVKELGPGCPQLILAQTPKSTTFKDFWFMVWSQKSQLVVCLHPPAEILDTFWPTQLNAEVTHGDFSVTLMRQFDLSHCTELSLKVTMLGSDAIHYCSLLQMKAPWGKGSCSHILGIAQNVIDALRRLQSQDGGGGGKSWPVVINSLTGADRSGCLSVAITAILGAQARRPVLINVIDVWFRICSQRKGALEDAENLLLSYKIVLQHGHELLNKHGIMTSHQLKTAQTAAVEAKQEILDPLSQLDPLWKLK